MKESYEQGLANRSASNPTLAMVTSRVWHGQEVHAGQAIQLRNHHFSRADLVLTVGRQHAARRHGKSCGGRGGVKEPGHAWKLQSREPGDPVGFRPARVACSPPVRNGQKTSQTVMLT